MNKKISAINHEAPDFFEIDNNENDLYQMENISLNETKEIIELRKRALEYESSYVFENLDKMIYIHANEVKDIAECNLLHDIINPPKIAKNINSHYYHILHGCMNTIKGRVRFKNFQILSDSGCSSTIVMRRLFEKHTLKNML